MLLVGLFRFLSSEEVSGVELCPSLWKNGNGYDWDLVTCTPSEPSWVPESPDPDCLAAMPPGLVWTVEGYFHHEPVWMMVWCSGEVGPVTTIGGGFGSTEVVNCGVCEVGVLSHGRNTESLLE